MPDSRWLRLGFVAAASAAGAWLVYRWQQARLEADGGAADEGTGSASAEGSGASRRDLPADGGPRREKSRYFGLPSEQQRVWLIEKLRGGGSLNEMLQDARNRGRLAEVQGPLLDLLMLKDPRMMSAAYDTLTRVDADGHTRHEKVNLRVDDAAFKESLLELLMELIETDSPLVEKMVEAFRREDDPTTKMRIVRAMARIGGRRARSFIEDLVREEGDGPWIHEARRQLGT